MRPSFHKVGKEMERICPNARQSQGIRRFELFVSD